MSKSRLRRALPAALVVAAALPFAGPAASADAAPKKAKAQQTVAQHAKASQKATKRLAKAIAKQDDKGALAALKESRSRIAAASRSARAGATGGATPTTTTTNGLSTVAGVYDANLEAYLALIPYASELVQKALAQALNPSIAGREQAINLLTQLLPSLPEAARGPVSQVIAQLSAETPEDVSLLGNLAEFGQNGALPVDVLSLVTSTLNTVTATLQSTLVRLEEIQGLLGRHGAGHGSIVGAQEDIAGQLPGIAGLLDGLIPAVTGIATDQIKMVSQLVDGILGGVVKPILGMIPSFLPGNLIPPVLPGTTGAQK